MILPGAECCDPASLGNLGVVLLCLHEAAATRWEGRAARAVAGMG